MSASSHISQLRQKHEALSKKIEDEQQRPGSGSGPALGSARTAVSFGRVPRDFSVNLGRIFLTMNLVRFDYCYISTC
jgi:hypothetical protein